MTNKKEEWREIPDYEGMYMVSNRGRVKSVNYNGTKEEGVLKPFSNGNVYLYVSLSKDRKKKHRTVHSLVAQTFLGHVPCGHKVEVNHIDGVKTNNNLSNLELLTKSEHSIETWKHRGKSSIFAGVSWAKRNKKWKVQIRVDGKQKCIGHFTNEIDASKAYQRALKNNTV